MIIAQQHCILIYYALSPSPIIICYEAHHLTHCAISLTAPAGEIEKGEKERGGLQKKFKLDGSIATTNMMMFDMNSIIRKFER